MADDKIKQAINGDDDALIACMQQISKQMTWTAISLLGDEELAKDCIMENTIKVYKKRKSIRQPEFFKTWVIRILINECKNELKRQRKYVPLPENFDVAAPMEVSVDFVHDLIDTLPFELKQILVLRFFHDLTFREIGDVIQTPESTVKSRYKSALQRLRVEMEIE